MIGHTTFSVPIANNIYFRIEKDIETFSQLLYYLYLSSITLPDNGDIYPYYYTFREKREYQINDNLKINMFEKEFVFVYDLENFNNDEICLPGGVYILKIYCLTDNAEIIINGNDLFEISKTIIDYYLLENGITINTDNVYLLANISEIRMKSLNIHFYSRNKSLDLKIIAHIDKQSFIRWFENYSITSDEELEVYTNTICVTYEIDNIAKSIDAKNNLIVSNQAELIDVHLSRYYNPQIIYDDRILLLRDKSLFDVFYNYLDGLVFTYYFSRPYLNNIDQPLNPRYLNKLYNVDETKLIHYLFPISAVSELNNIYFMRRIPGLRYIKYILGYTGGSTISSNTYLDYFKPFNQYFINYDIVTIQDDILCIRFRREESLDTIIPMVSNVYLPMISILINYQDGRYLDSYLFSEIIFDAYHYIYAIMSSEITDFRLWDNSLEQKNKFLINTMSYSDLPIYEIHNVINLFPQKIHDYFNKFVYFKSLRLDKFQIDVPNWCKYIVFTKSDTNEFNLQINDIEITNPQEIDKDILPELLYMSFMFRPDNSLKITLDEYINLKNTVLEKVNPASYNISLQGNNIRYYSNNIVWFTPNTEIVTVQNSSHDDWTIFLISEDAVNESRSIPSWL